MTTSVWSAVFIFVIITVTSSTLATRELDYKAGEAIAEHVAGGEGYDHHHHAVVEGSLYPAGHFYGHHPTSTLGGECAVDGYFLHDAYSFVMCSNGKAHIQQCAPGTRNNPNKIYSGYAYQYTDFCNENLNDLGYGITPYATQNTGYGHGYGYGGYGYGYPYYGYYGGYYPHSGYHPYGVAYNPYGYFY